MDRTLAWAFFVSAVLAFTTYEVRTVTKHHSPSNAVAASSPAKITAANPKSSASCVGSELRLSWPFRGTPDKDWVIVNYVDLDPSPDGIMDYTGKTGPEAMTYDGHTGVDIEVPSFRAVDNGFPILAAADGVVEEVYDDSFDHNLSCSTDKWNYVKLRHANGFSTTYAHAKKKSIVVHVGQKVTAGTRLAIVGSSGCSSYPHLHFEVGDCEENVVDPMKEQMFISPPPYSRDRPATVMETTVFQPTINSMLSIQDPGNSDVSEVAIGSKFSIGMTISHLHRGDILSIDFITPSNTRADFSYSQVMDQDYVRSSWWGDFFFDRPGSWVAQIKVNSLTQVERPILVQQQ